MQELLRVYSSKALRAAEKDMDMVSRPLSGISARSCRAVVQLLTHEEIIAFHVKSCWFHVWSASQDEEHWHATGPLPWNPRCEWTSSKLLVPWISLLRVKRSG